MNTLDRNARGVYLITVTPFADDGSLDLASTDRMVDFYLERGATGLTILGIMGEATKLTADESRTFVTHAAHRRADPGLFRHGRRNPRIPGALGLAGPSGFHRGADGSLCGDPYPEERSELRHAQARGQSRAGQTVGDPRGGCQRRHFPRVDSDRQWRRPVPEMMVDVCQAHAAGDAERAHDLFDAYLPLARYEQQAGVGLAVRKHLMVARGAIASAMIRRPGPRLSGADVADIGRLMRRQEKRLLELGAPSR